MLEAEATLAATEEAADKNRYWHSLLWRSRGRRAAHPPALLVNVLHTAMDLARHDEYWIWQAALGCARRVEPVVDSLERGQCQAILDRCMVSQHILAASGRLELPDESRL